MPAKNDVMQVVADAISEAGGQITHNALLESLQQSGNAQYAAQLISLAQSGQITATVKAVAGGNPVLTYEMPAE